MEKKNIYIVGPWADFSFIGGFSVIFLLVTWGLVKFVSPTHFFTASALLVWVVNWPHFSATNYRLYSKKENMMTYQFTSFVVPFLVLAATVYCFFSQAEFAPLYIAFYLIWSPYHFSGQTKGITLLYARRAGIKFDERIRFLISTFIFSTFLYPTLSANSGLHHNNYFGIQAPSLGIPTFFGRLTYYYMIGVGLFLMGYFIYRKIKHNERIHPIVFLPPITQLVWFVIGNRVPAYNALVPAFHSLQYLFIAWGMQIFEKGQDVPGEGIQKFIKLESLKWFAINFVGGSLLFYFIPKGISGATGISAPFTMGVFIASVQVHHFFVDGVIWKLKNQAVRHPLSMSLSDLKGKAA